MRLFPTACAALALTAFLQPAFAACLTRADATALKIAVMRQQLIVAALKCGEAGSYHLFADSFRDDLRRADGTVQEYFTARGGKGEYEAFRAKAARLAWAAEAADSKTFCADARALLSAAKPYRALDDFTQARARGTNALCLPRTAAAATPVALKTPAPTPRPALPDPRPAPTPIPTPIPTPRSVQAVPLRNLAAIKPLMVADIATPEEPPKIGRYYTPPLDIYDVEDDLPVQSQVRAARQESPRDAEPAYVRRDWNERGHGPAHGWRTPQQASWQPQDSWRQDDWQDRDDWRDPADWYEEDGSW